MSYTATGADDLGGVFVDSVSECLDIGSLETTPVWDARGSVTYVNGRGALAIEPEAWVQELVPSTCVQSSDQPIRAKVVGGTGEFKGITGHVDIDFVSPARLRPSRSGVRLRDRAPLASSCALTRLPGIRKPRHAGQATMTTAEGPRRIAMASTSCTEQARRLLLATLALASFGVLAPPVGAAAPTFEDWLARQGTREKDLDSDGTCGEPYEDQYVPAHRSYIYWFDPRGRIGLVDYLGISGRYLREECGVDLGTSVQGSLSVRDVGDGMVLVGVRGHARNALIYVADDPGHTFDARVLPLLCGNWESTVCEGGTPSVAEVTFNIQYYAPADSPIADLQWFGNPPPEAGDCADPDDAFGFRFIMLRAAGNVTLADGSPGVAVINQTGIFQPHGSSSHYDGFPAEFIDVHSR
jgi:hypothetical protein